MTPEDAVLQNHERCRAHLIDATLVMSRLRSDMARTMADLREAAVLHARWLVEHEQNMAALDRKLGRIEGENREDAR
jgi:hypothetical protein